MLHKTRGIVLQSIKYSESSNILKIYTEAFGLKSYIIRGLRKSKSRTKASLFQHLSLLELVVYDKDKKDIQNIKEVRPAYIFRDIPFNINKSSIILFMNELINKSIREEESNPEMFEFIYGSIVRLDKLAQGEFNFHLVFIILFTKYLGFYPMHFGKQDFPFLDLQEGLFQKSRPSHSDFLSGENSSFIRQILVNGFEIADQLEIPARNRKEMLNSMLQYYRLHLPDFSPMKSPAVLHSVFH
ncbi:MAG: DNA repair protein RecO [Bacteroidales bacterium]|nr:DNA repair protein RecO [Bacteroidales bacterium]MCF8386462.1 DNA repair protein RecO [Bacteroidales bacterium]MCF8397794.1 DNA repair protein RecO [Bacteroidales bacterium]